MPKQRASGPTQPWSVEVDVYLEDASDPANPRFRIESLLKSGPNDELVFDNRGRPGFTIRFYLHDQTQSGYEFPQQARDGAWSRIGQYPQSCPNTQAHQVLVPIRVFKDGKTLVASNPNPGPPPGQGPFCYALRVTNDGGQTHLLLDPGGINQNGSAR